MGNDIYVGNWSRWLEMFGNMPNREGTTRKTRYVKPQCLADFEREYNAKQAERYANIPPECRVQTKFSDRDANSLTRAIIAHLRMHGHFAARVNSTGVYDQRRGTWRTSNARKGLADVTAVINGRAVQLEVKTGRDRPRSEQMRVQAEVKAAGGVYEFVHNFADYLQIYNAITAKPP